jgi:hypothetical protein
MALFLPMLKQAKEVANRAVCANNQKQLLVGVISYAGDFNSYMPELTLSSFTIKYYTASGYPPHALGNLYHLDYLPNNAVNLLLCPGYKPDGRTGGTPGNFLSTANAIGAGLSFDDTSCYNYFPVVFCPSSDSKNHSLADVGYFKNCPVIISDIISLTPTGAYNAVSTFGAGYCHRLQGINCGFTDGSVHWVLVKKIVDVGNEKAWWNYENYYRDRQFWDHSKNFF